MADHMTAGVRGIGLRLAAAAVPVGSIVILIGVAVSNWWISIPGLLVLVGGYAAFHRWRAKPTTVSDVLFGWFADPRPAPTDIVDRHRDSGEQ